jgi:hypothetical protein
VRLTSTVAEYQALARIEDHANRLNAEFHGRRTLFVALELLGDPPYDGIVISHEALHLAHMHHGAATWPDDVGAYLIQEGVATAASRELHPRPFGQWLSVDRRPARLVDR